MNGATAQHSPDDDRRHGPRSQGDDSVILIDDKPYEIRNLSASGILVEPYSGRLADKTMFPFTLMVAGDDGRFMLQGEAIVVRRAPESMAARFFFIPSPDKDRLDAYFERKFKTRLFHMTA